MTNPPPLPKSAEIDSRGKPFAFAALIIAVIGLLPLIIYFFNCISQLGTRNSYFESGNPLLIIAMGFIGLIIHGIGLLCGIIGQSLGSTNYGFIGLIANAAILGAILLFGFIAIAGAQTATHHNEPI